MSPNLASTAERFAQLIDFDAPPLLLDGGDPRMRPAVALTAALRSTAATAAPAPLSSDARSMMRERLVALAAAPPAAEALPGIATRITHSLEQGQQRAAGAGRKIGRRMSALVGSVVILTSLTGVGVATARSLPGSPFYDLKRVTESIQLWATSGQDAKGQFHLALARTRLAEAQRLPADSSHLSSTLRAMNNQTRQANTDLLNAYQATGSLQPLANLVTFARRQYVDLAKLGTNLPAKLHQQAMYSALLLTGVSHEVKSLTIGLCAKCGTGDNLSPVPSGSKPAVAPTPSASGNKPTGGAATPSTHPTKSPSGLLPSGLTNLLPTNPATTHKNGQQKVLPKLSPVPLISSLAQLLGG
ncbi:MAG TPA: DUF5667 domain-containing protein [Mycobacteriales bacterium]|jgi:hypothetical protein|nr:DUF5667 domain-containing protein [Mycobacteriales bacterium]